MKSYFLIESFIRETSEISALVLATDIESPLEHIHEVEQELSSCIASGLVVFDLLISHGNKRNRFLSAYFDGKKFSSYDFKASIVSYDVCSRLAATALKQHNTELNDTLLSKSMKFAVKMGIPF